MMAGVRDPWVMLGIERTATDAEIKRAYRKLAKAYHPDRNPGNKEAEDRFQDISRAFDSIKSEQARAGWLATHESRPVFDDGAFPPIPDHERAGGSWEREIKREVTVDFRDAFTGTQVDLVVEVEDVCNVCGGTGAAPGSAPQPCRLCGGSGQHRVAGLRNNCSGCGGAGYTIERPCPHCTGGFVRESRPFVLSIPPGVPNGYQLRIPGPQRGRFGSTEVQVTVHVLESEVFQRNLPDAADLQLDLPITYSEACFGAQVRIPTPSKIVIVKIPAGTASGTMFRVPGEGMPHVGSDDARRGDLYARVQIIVPDKLSHSQKKLLKQLAQHDPEDARYPLFAKLAGQSQG